VWVGKCQWILLRLLGLCAKRQNSRRRQIISSEWCSGKGFLVRTLLIKSAGPVEPHPRLLNELPAVTAKPVSPRENHGESFWDMKDKCLSEQQVGVMTSCGAFQPEYHLENLQRLMPPTVFSI